MHVVPRFFLDIGMVLPSDPPSSWLLDVGVILPIDPFIYSLHIWISESFYRVISLHILYIFSTYKTHECMDVKY